MSAHWTWARAEIRARRRGLVAVALLIGLTAGAALTGFAGARRTASSYDRFRDVARAPDALATTTPEKLPALQRIGRLPEVEAAATGSIFAVFRNLQSDFDIGLFGPNDDNLGRTVYRGVVLSGRLPRPDHAEEVALNPTVARNLAARVGDTLTLGTLTPAQVRTIEQSFSGKLEGPRLRLRVTGIVRQTDDLLGDAANNVIIGTPAFAERYRDRIGRFLVFGGYRLERGASYRDFSRAARPLIGVEGETSLVGEGATSTGVRDALRFLTTGLVLVALAAVVVGVVAGSQALSRQLGLATRDQAPLAALGFTRRDRAIALVLVSIPIAVGAAMIAALSAFLASPLTPINLGRDAEPHPGLRLDPLVHAGGAVVTAALVLAGAAIAGWIVAARTAEVTAERLRPSLGARAARTLRLGAGGTTGVRLALEPGQGRRAVPVRSAIVAALVAVGGLIGALTFSSSLDRVEASPARYGQPWHLLPDAEDAEVPRMAALADVEDFGLVVQSSVTIEGDGFTGYAMRPVKGSPGFTMLSGRPPANVNEIAVGRDLLDQFRTRLGRTVEVNGRDGDRRTFRVVGTFLGPTNDQDPIGGAALFTPAALSAVRQGDLGRQPVLRWRDDVDPRAATARFKAAFPGGVSAYAAPRPPGEIVNLARVRDLPRVAGGILAAVGIAALLHALATSTRRRRHDLAVLRAVGLVRPQVVVAVTTQAVTIAIVAVVAGIPVGIAVGRWAWMLTADAIGVANDPRVPLLAAAAVVVGALAVANAMGLPLGISAGRARPAPALRAE